MLVFKKLYRTTLICSTRIGYLIKNGGGAGLHVMRKSRKSIVKKQGLQLKQSSFTFYLICLGGFISDENKITLVMSIFRRPLLVFEDYNRQRVVVVVAVSKFRVKNE